MFESDRCKVGELVGEDGISDKEDEGDELICVDSVFNADGLT